MLARRIAGGIASYIPGFNSLRAMQTGNSGSARYCYAVWFRHLLLARQHGLPRVPESVAELGPGDSLGAGLSALLSGASRYTALDRTVYARPESNLAVFEELVELFRSRAPVPPDSEFPAVWPPLARPGFPSDLLDDALLERTLAPARLEKIRESIRRGGHGDDDMVRYVAPWNLQANVLRESVDFVYSQAVLEHVDDVPDTYRSIRAWLRPGALASHTVDFCCHDMEPRWNIQWTYSPLLWKLQQGRRPWRLNRQPLSAHLAALAAAGFEVIHEVKRVVPSAIGREELAAAFRQLPDTDLTTDSATLVTRAR